MYPYIDIRRSCKLFFFFLYISFLYIVSFFIIQFILINNWVTFPEIKLSHRQMGIYRQYINGLMQKRRNSIANALELHLLCIKPSIWYILM